MRNSDRYVAGDVGLVGAGGPDHDHLRLGEQQRIGAVALLAQLVDLGLARRQARCAVRVRVRNSVIAVATAEQDDAERERQGREFVPLERRERVEVVR